MGRIRVLIVDDAVVVRKILSDALATDPDIEIAGVAANGRIALSKIRQINPDIVTMDIEMPEMDGLATLKELRKEYTNLPVIMFSTLTERGGEATLDALSLGASDYVTKPSNVGNVTEAKQRIQNDLIPKIKHLCASVIGLESLPTAKGSKAGAPPASTPRARATQPKSTRIDIVAIGSSTGGPNALAELIPALPGDLRVPIVITQHMPPVFTRLLAERLDGKSPLTVREGEDGGPVGPGRVWLAPGGHHMVVKRDGARRVLVLNDDPPENSCRPAVDPMLRSVVNVYGGNVLAVILTGMGQDGLRGVEMVHDAGGHIIAQDEATSVVWGMPGFVSRAGLADRVLPLSKLGTEITRMVQHPAT